MAEKSKKVANQYERGYDYTKYWDNRDYENAAEHIAIRRLLKGQHYGSAADIGGGFGRLCILLRTFADKVTLAEPAASQLEAAKKVLEGTDIVQAQMQADDLKFADGELDLVTMVRVMHHIPEPAAEFAEISRVLAPGGTAIIEVANYGHFKNRRRHKREGIELPKEPVSIRTVKADEPDAIAFVNHNIDTVVGQLAEAGLTLESKLSVSNLRSERVKKTLPKSAMLLIERATQKRLARNNFGPSIFLKLRKPNSYRTIARNASAEIEVSRSRFLCEVRRVDSEVDARAFVREARRQYHDARHHCSAFVIGADSALRRSNDDGEPSGTAGAPMLEVLTHRGVSDVVAVVARWFGGTLLGAGGLVRAYGESVGLALDEAGVRDRQLRHLMNVTADVSDAGVLDHRLRALGDVTDVAYAAEAVFTVAVVDPDAFIGEVASVSGGRAQVGASGTTWVDV